ncbi:phosphatidylglycerophosphatase A [Alkalilimnicola sp. S0819]|uniref:phosphatidylglycerophosphatase A family protein n=1 Tax=Alkalilimnicola sp. S0819 TaxID=2613922 RepID=UPI00126238A3|nr:phosphatidylglycerophosphatase A [Alkalilimnicola sp. S0819]KAB7622757.1 phosphatidylglycerophosphatase A [Alkalilimnicola sp. S0819]MPQ17250.1 phosphatidylglycerophosphatase A [Alkalilimnicola sp. S0819]
MLLNPRKAFNLKNPIHLLALGFGTGLAPKAPGTAGTLVGIPFYLLAAPLHGMAYLGVVLLLFAAGVLICDQAARDAGVHDHPAIVWDEVVGFMLAMLLIPPHWGWILAGFLAFRFFDVLKPWPIGWLDRRVTGGLGIMLDDMLAGLYAAAVLHGARLLLA